jgi:ribosome-associated protein
MESLIHEDSSPSANVELAPGVSAPSSALRFQFSRSGGPGGQNVNKLNTKAELWLSVDAIVGLTHRARQRLVALAGKRLTQSGEIHLASESERTQEGNRSSVLQRLRELIVSAAHEPKPRRKTKPTRASKRRRLESKRSRSQIKSRRGQVYGEE